MSPALALVCTQCGGPRIERSRESLADAVRDAVKLSLREEDPERRHKCLTAHLLWFEAELRGRCTNCTLEEASVELAAASVEVTRLPGNVLELRPRRPRTHFYEGLAQLEPVRTSANPSDSDDSEKKRS